MRIEKRTGKVLNKKTLLEKATELNKKSFLKEAKKFNKKTLLEESKELNMTRRNVISKEYLQEAIKDTIIKYKEIILCVDIPICKECLNFESRKRLIKTARSKAYR